jgi:hypothetical protein
VHEASHLVIAHRIGMKVKKLEVLADGGYSHHDHEHARLVDYLTMLLAGETAEVEVFGCQVLPRTHPGSDRERLYLAVAKAGAIGQQELFVARQKVVRLVRTHRATIIGLASQIMDIVHRDTAARPWADLDVSIENDHLAGLLDVDGAGVLRRAAV